MTLCTNFFLFYFNINVIKVSMFWEFETKKARKLLAFHSSEATLRIPILVEKIVHVVNTFSNPEKCDFCACHSYAAGSSPYKYNL